MHDAWILDLLRASIAVLVIGIGLQATAHDAGFLVRHPALFARTLLSMHVVLPLAALLITVVLEVAVPVRVALLALAISPIPPFLPPRVNKAGGRGSYVIGLLVATSLFSVVILPASIWCFERIFGVPIHVPMLAFLKVIGSTLLGPLAVGLALRRFVPASARFAKPLVTAATILLAVAVIPVVVTSAPAFRHLIGDGTLAVICLVTLAGLAAGHLLGGPAHDDRPVLALSTACRHPAVAIVLARANFPDEPLVIPAILLALIVSALVATPYVVWRKRDTAIRMVPT